MAGLVPAIHVCPSLPSPRAAEGREGAEWQLSYDTGIT